MRGHYEIRQNGNSMIKKTGGFTLIELMIVLAVLSIIVAVGYPSGEFRLARANTIVS